MNNIKLTSYSSGAGWACKINPKDLGKILEKLNENSLFINKDISLAITGYWTIERGITFNTDGFNFTHMIISKYHSNKLIDKSSQTV